MVKENSLPISFLMAVFTVAAIITFMDLLIFKLMARIAIHWQLLIVMPRGMTGVTSCRLVLTKQGVSCIFSMIKIFGRFPINGVMTIPTLVS